MFQFSDGRTGGKLYLKSSLATKKSNMLLYQSILQVECMAVQQYLRNQRLFMELCIF